MTSAAVSNITAPVTAAGSSAKDTNKVAEGADVTFQNLLQNPKQQNKSLTSQANVVTPQKADNAGGVKAAEKPYEAVSKREAVRIDDASKGSKAVLSEEEMAQAQEAVSAFAEEVKQVLEEELNVTEEEIENAMQTLGLTFLDLSTPDQLVQLIGVLTGTEETTDLLTNQNLNGIMAQVSELVTNLTEETGIPMEELTALGMTETDDTQDADFQNILTEAAVSGEGPEMTDAPAEENAPAFDVRMTDQKEAVKEEVPQDIPEEVQPESEGIRTQSVEVQTTERQMQQETGGKESQTGKEPAKEEHTQAPDRNMPEAHHAVQQTAARVDAEVIRPEQSEFRPTVDVRDLMEQFQQFARTNITADTTSIEMRLNPESLGRLLIHVTEQEGSVRATIQTQSEQVREAMEGQLAVLRTTLEGQGIKVTEVEVTVASHEFEENLEKGNADAGMNEEQQQGERAGEEAQSGRRRNLNLNNLDELQGLMSEEEMLVAQIMKDNGNSVDFTA